MDYTQAYNRLIVVQSKYHAALTFAKEVITYIPGMLQRVRVIEGLEVIDASEDRVVVTMSGRIICFQFVDFSVRPQISIGPLRMGADGLTFRQTAGWLLKDRVLTDVHDTTRSFEADDIQQQFYVVLARAIDSSSSLPTAEAEAIRKHLKDGAFLIGF